MSNDSLSMREKVARIIDPERYATYEWSRANSDTLFDISDVFDKADAILRLISDGEGWQPIESAPKDGSEIVGYRPDQGVFVFRWAEMEEFVPKDLNGDAIEEYDDIADWWHDRWCWMQGDETPTHWHPLPTPPSQDHPHVR